MSEHFAKKIKRCLWPPVLTCCVVAALNFYESLKTTTASFKKKRTVLSRFHRQYILTLALRGERTPPQQRNCHNPCMSKLSTHFADESYT